MFASRLEKMTAGLAFESGSFSASLVTTAMVATADYFGIVSGRNTDKCRDTGVSWSKGSVVDFPVLADLPWVYECRLTDTLTRSRHSVFLGEVMGILVDSAVDPTYGKVDLTALDPVIYSPGRYYSISSQVFEVGASRQRFLPRL